jgi:hypothetical protein
LSIVTAALSLSILAAGCSTGGDDGSTPAPSGTAMSASAEPGSSDDSSGDDSADGDLTAWAGQMCDAVRPMVERTQEFAPPTDFSDPSSFLDQYRSMIDDLGDAFADAKNAVEDLDAPPIENGPQIKQDMLTVLDQASSLYQRLGDSFASLDPNDPSSLASIGPELQELLPEIEDAARELDQAFDSDAMKDAVAAAPQCDGLDLGQ